MAPAFDGRDFRAIRLIDPVRTRRCSIGHCDEDWGVRFHVRTRSVGSCVPAARAQAADNGYGLNCASQIYRFLSPVQRVIQDPIPFLILFGVILLTLWLWWRFRDF